MLDNNNIQKCLYNYLVACQKKKKCSMKIIDLKLVG